jgi:hypothetical protein
MVLFTVAKGTKGMVMRKCGLTIKPWVTRHELVFDREELLLDPVTFQNKNSLFNTQIDLWHEMTTQMREVSGDQVKTAIIYAEKGYSVFIRDGILLIIPFVNAPVMES